MIRVLGSVTSENARPSDPSDVPTSNASKQLLVSFHHDGAAQNLNTRHLLNRHRRLLVFLSWLEKRDIGDVADVAPDDVKAYLVDRRGSLTAGSVRTLYQTLHSFFAWCEREGEITKSPMRQMRSPKAVEKAVPVMTDEAVKALLDTCRGNDFADRRDQALIRLLIATGLRAATIVAIQSDHIDWTLRTIEIPRIKGGDSLVVRFDVKTRAAMDRYLRVRVKHNQADSPFFWLTNRGGMSYPTLYHILVERGKQAGLDMWPHRLRHQFAHLFLASGGQERDLMKLTGWRSSAMLARYGASAALQRALDSYDEHAPGDKF